MYVTLRKLTAVTSLISDSLMREKKTHNDKRWT